MKKISLNFLNRLELAIFRNMPEGYTPLSSRVALSTLAAAVVSLILIFIMQMFNVDKSAGEITLAVIFGVAFLYSGYVCYRTIDNVPSVGQKIALSVYALVLFAVCALAFIWLMVWVMIIAICIAAVWLVLKVTSSDSKNKKRIRAHYSDGTTEEMTESSRGMLGETYYEGERGGKHTEY